MALALLLSAIVVTAVVELAARHTAGAGPIFTPTDSYAQWAMAFLGVIGAATSVLGVVWIRSTLVEARRTANAAVEANATARDVGQAQVRAYVFYKFMRWTWHTAINGGHLFYRFRPVWTNSGPTPTRGLRIFAQHMITTEPLSDTYEFVVPPSVVYAPMTLSKDDEIEGQAFDVTGTQMEAIRQGRAHYYIWGIATYRDVFGDTPMRVTRFCCYAEPNGITGDQNLPPSEQNTVRFQFNLYWRHNCSDEECFLEFGPNVPLTRGVGGGPGAGPAP